jgi:hypothetical protein
MQVGESGAKRMHEPRDRAGLIHSCLYVEDSQLERAVAEPGIPARSEGRGRSERSQLRQ